ncbi:MAG: DUF1552 domain-containing protein [Acidimicrobiia bacterium]|nr:DUF1552 domain-containing protein [Acidimicrobiia bacterium]
MIVTQTHLPRRALLRGAGAAIALPFLDGMVPALTAVRRTAAAPALRLCAVYVAMGCNMDRWTPKTQGALELSPTLMPLKAYRDRMLVVSNLDSEGAMARPDDGGGVHSRIQPTWLTGVHVKKTDGPGMQAGISMDQIAAQQVGQETQLASLELALESADLVGACELGYTCAYTATLAWRTPSTPLPMEINPRAVFERLFGDSESTDPRSRLARLQENRSLLDAVTDDVARLERRIGPRDRVKLSEYLDSIREVERRIQKAEEQGSQELPVVEQPVGIPATYQEYGELMFDLLALAYQADLTRVSTFLMARELSNRTYPEIGITEPHHPLSHHMYDPDKLAKQAKLNTFHLRIFSHFLERLGSIQDGDGTVLDRTMVLYGSGMSDSNAHNPLKVPTLVVAGKDTGLTGGQHVGYPDGTPLANLQLTLLERMGCQVERFGDSTGTLGIVAL